MQTTKPENCFADVFLLENSNHTAKMVTTGATGVAILGIAIILASFTGNLTFLVIGGIGFIGNMLATSWTGAGADLAGREILANIASNLEKKYWIKATLEEKSAPENYWVNLEKTKEYTFFTADGEKKIELYFLPNSEPVIVRTSD